MVECGLPKPETRVRFPSPAPLAIKDLHSCAGKVQEDSDLCNYFSSAVRSEEVLPGQGEHNGVSRKDSASLILEEFAQLQADRSQIHRLPAVLDRMDGKYGLASSRDFHGSKLLRRE